MKKIFLILLLILIPGMTFSQTMFLKKLDVKDSIYSTSGTGIINMSEFYKNGVPFSSGGGDVYLGNRQTFSARNEFDDTIIANGYGEFDNIKLTNYINFLGDVISDFGFIKGANVTINTRDNYSLRLGANNDSAMIIDKNNKVTFIDTVKFDRITIMDSLISKNLMITNAGGIIQWLNGGGSQIYQVSNVLYFKQNEFDFLNINNYGLLTVDSLNGMSLFYGSYNGNGSGLTNLNATELTSGTISSSRLPTITRSITSYHAAITTTPADATTYYWGSREGIAPVTIEGFARVYFPVNCTIKSAIVYLYSGGAGTSETISYSIRKNATTDYSIGSGQATTAAGFNTAVLNGSMTVPISAGDWVEFKAVCPTWATNPTNIFFQVTIGIE